MSSRHSSRYLHRARAASAVMGAGEDLSEGALAFLRAPTDRLSAPVFNELLTKGYVEPQGRTWHWTMRAKCLMGKES